MKKTIFYIPSETLEGDYWFSETPYKILLELDNILYETDGNIIRNILVGKYIERLTVIHVEDRFSNEGIIRRIGFYITK